MPKKTKPGNSDNANTANTNSANTERGVGSKRASQEHDSHGTPFSRVPGPGPKDVDNGAAGAQAIDRIEGGLEKLPKGGEGAEADSDEDSESKE